MDDQIRDLFDVTTGAYQGEEVFEIVGALLLHQLSKKNDKKNIGLCRNDGLAIFKNISRPQSEKNQKNVSRCILLK